ncbi:MAG: MEMO1 family protein [Bryobacterales bacterium]|nr:MEMO1 family protein [Bryobacterales bacterium]
MEDYCHATEHSIEFQVAFLQHTLDGPGRSSSLLAADGRPMMTGGLLGPDGRPLTASSRGHQVKILPILCGAYAHSIYEGGLPEDDENVARFIGALGEMAARRARDLVFILGVDMAHMGVRYGDQITALAGAPEMQEVEQRDQARIAALNAGDSRGFWDLVQQNQDDLKWCGASPFYTFTKAVPGARGALRRYGQWNIDEASVVSFAGMTFTA